MNYYLIYVLLGLAVAGVFAWLVMLLRQERKEVGDDVIWDTKLCPNITNGYTKLIQKDVKIGKTGRWLVTAEAKDVDSKKAERAGIKLPIIVRFAIPPELTETLSKGDSSRDRHERIALPRNAKDIPSKLRETAFGHSWAEHVEGKNRTRAIEEIMTKDNQAQTKIAGMLGNNNLLLELQKVVTEFQKMQAEAMKDFKKPATSSYSSPTSHLPREN